MGKIHVGILGGFQGKVGTVIGSRWRGEDIIRAKPGKRPDRPTDQQKIQRLKFKAVSEFLNPLRGILSTYFGSESGVKSRYNLATSYHLTDAVEVTDEVAEILYPRVMVSKGTLSGFQNPVTSLAGTDVTLQWEDNSMSNNARAEDGVNLVFYSAARQEYYVYENVVAREALTATVSLSGNLAGTSVEAYAFLYSATAKLAANSVYLGSLALE